MMGKIVKWLICFLIGLAQVKAYDKNDPPYIKYAEEIMDEFAREMNKEYGLICIGDGGGLAYDVRVLNVKFIAYLSLNLEEARELEVRATQRLLEKINQHEKIRPFLREYPFPPYRAEVSIQFKDQNDDYPAGSIAYVSQIKNTIYFCIENPTKKNTIKEISSEPFEKAAKIVAQNPPHNFKLKKARV